MINQRTLLLFQESEFILIPSSNLGKLSTLCEMLACFHEHKERCVIASSYAKVCWWNGMTIGIDEQRYDLQTLDMIEKLCNAMDFRVFRLDGDTPVQVRQKIVDQFNTTSDPNSVFLLSKKAGSYSSSFFFDSNL